MMNTLTKMTKEGIQMGNPIQGISTTMKTKMRI